MHLAATTLRADSENPNKKTTRHSQFRCTKSIRTMKSLVKMAQACSSRKSRSERQREHERKIWDSNLSLFQYLQNPSFNNSQQEQSRIAGIALDLGLGTAVATQADGELVCLEPVWSVQPEHVRELTQLPKKYGHAGAFEWEGPESTGSPKWFWDSSESRTVAADQTVLQEGYIAISYTWGRWKSGETIAAGTSWPVPVVDESVFASMLQTIKDMMAAIPSSRYFWLDVLCINQHDPEEKAAEISKQAAIFGNAKAVLSYLWSLETEDELCQPITSLGDLVLWAVQFSDWARQTRSELRGHTKHSRSIAARFEAKLRLDPWFSSLWALQEMTLAPASIWVTRSGHLCRVNGLPVTSRFFAQAARLLEWAHSFRQRIYEEFTGGYPLSNELPTISFGHLLNAAIDNDGQPQSPSLSTEAAIKLPEVTPIWESKTNMAYRELPNELKGRQAEEMRYLSEVKRWIEWASGEVGLHLVVHASRRDILVAGVNRHSTKRRALALLAALKISYDTAYEDTKHLVSGSVPASLINKVLQVEDARFFCVSHQSRMPIDKGSGG